MGAVTACRQASSCPGETQPPSRRIPRRVSIQGNSPPARNPIINLRLGSCWRRDCARLGHRCLEACAGTRWVIPPAGSSGGPQNKAAKEKPTPKHRRFSQNRELAGLRGDDGESAASRIFNAMGEAGRPEQSSLWGSAISMRNKHRDHLQISTARAPRLRQKKYKSGSELLSSQKNHITRINLN